MSWACASDMPATTAKAVQAPETTTTDATNARQRHRPTLARETKPRIVRTGRAEGKRHPLRVLSMRPAGGLGESPSTHR